MGFFKNNYLNMRSGIIICKMSSENTLLNKKIDLFMPVQKSSGGSLVGILSDTSMDRDEEFIGKKLLESWAKKMDGLHALADHDNQMSKWVGGWTDLKTITKNGHTALVGTPWFFTKEANPLANSIRLQVEESLAKGLNAGISISAIVKGVKDVELNGKSHRQYTDGELLEATWVPIQSNRNANYGHIAKQFGLTDNKTLNKEENTMEETVEVKDKSAEVLALEKSIAEKDAKILELEESLAKANEVPEVEEVKETIEPKKEVDIQDLVNKAVEKKLADRKFMLKALSEDAEQVTENLEKEPQDIRPTADNLLKAMRK